jgi:hypothetical protein
MWSACYDDLTDTREPANLVPARIGPATVDSPP